MKLKDYIISELTPIRDDNMRHRSSVAFLMQRTTTTILRMD